MNLSAYWKELPRQADRPALAGSRSWLWLATAAALLLFSNGANTVPLAAWLAPVFMLRFVRGQILKVGLPVAYLLLVAGVTFQFRGMVPIPGVAYYIFLVVWGIPLVLPYIIDRLLAHRLSGLTASLVFPTAWATNMFRNTPKNAIFEGSFTVDNGEKPHTGEFYLGKVNVGRPVGDVLTVFLGQRASAPKEVTGS